MKSPLSSRSVRLACALTSSCALALGTSATALAARSSGNDFGQNRALHLTKTVQTHAAAGSLSGTLVRTIIGLLIVIAVIYGIAWMIRQARSARNPASGDGLTQIATLPLGPSRSVSLVRVGAELHMLGIADHGITSIRVFTEEEAYELGLPFEPEDGYAGRGSGALGGRLAIANLVETLRRMTVRY